MSFRMPRNSRYPDYPDNDPDRRDLILQVYFDLDAGSRYELNRIVTQFLSWNIDEHEISRLENLIVMTGFVKAFSQSHTKIRMLWLTDNGRFQLRKYGKYSVYLKENID